MIGNTERTVRISVTARLVVGNKFGWFQWGFLSTFPCGKTFSQTRVQVGKVIPLFTTRVEMNCYTNNFSGLPCFKKLTADKHVLAELPLVPFVIINLTRLTVGVCMKVRFKSKVTRGFSSLRESIDRSIDPSLPACLPGCLPASLPPSLPRLQGLNNILNQFDPSTKDPVLILKRIMMSTLQ